MATAEDSRRWQKTAVVTTLTRGGPLRERKRNLVWTILSDWMIKGKIR